MPQTLLAILSMMVASLFAFNQHRNALSSQLKMIAQDIELRATSVAVEHMEEIGSLAFDQSTVLAAAESVEDLSGIRLETETIEGVIDDISDYHNRIVEITREKDGVEIVFAVQTEVIYIAKGTLKPSAMPTKLKKVTVDVTPRDTKVVGTVSISEIFTCASECSW